MNEHEYREKVVEWLKPFVAFPVENVAVWGAPDVCSLVGWIELKKASRPIYVGSTFVRPNMRNTQRLWHRRWWRGGGRSFALTIVGGTTWYLHAGDWAAGNYDRCTLLEFGDGAIHVYDGPPGEQLGQDLLNFKRETKK